MTLTTSDTPEKQAAQAFEALYTTVKRLRAPDGCPWDIEQTPMTLRSTLLEETYETLEAIEESHADGTKTCHTAEELGDVLLNAVMIAYMFEQDNSFSVADMITDLNNKLIRRHPHVFGQTAGFASPDDSAKPRTAEKVLAQWDTIKDTVEGRSSASVLDSIPKTFPPLTRAYKLQKRAAKKGFDWDSTDGPLHKIKEELDEFTHSTTGGNPEQMEEEFGDLLFSLVNTARHLHLDPAVALHRANSKFERRFRFVEKRMEAAGIPCSRETLPQMDSFWEEAKRTETGM
ncbi:MAG: nucleoside triphosphate pyrophosphohydrolase [Treponema sp.]